jgi:hypothetical protein
MGYLSSKRRRAGRRAERGNARSGQNSKGRSNQHERQELLYTYVTSPGFYRRVQGLADALVELQTEIDKERRSTARALNRRETIVRRAVLSVAGMYGDFQGYSGAALPDVPTLQLAEIEDSTEADVAEQPV